ncbi:MAG TPA: hypothetical protein VLH15_00045 [Dehalococcoidales bacterium]|nr:hypothetical protein [Dehalococcoidales bacterium]
MEFVLDAPTMSQRRLIGARLHFATTDRPAMPEAFFVVILEASIGEAEGSGGGEASLLGRLFYSSPAWINKAGKYERIGPEGPKIWNRSNIVYNESKGLSGPAYTERLFQANAAGAAESQPDRRCGMLNGISSV